MTISFHAWLTGTRHDDPSRALLAKDWKPRRGRLSCASVEKRAVEEYYAAPGVGAAAWAAYIAACIPVWPEKASALPSPSTPTTKEPT